MKRPPQLYVDIEGERGHVLEKGVDGCRFILPSPVCLARLCCIASWGEKWDHVSIHAEREAISPTGENTGKLTTDTPRWLEMAFVKLVCFMDDEWALEYHPPLKDYVNTHEHTLHLWKPQDRSVPRPPKKFV